MTETRREWSIHEVARIAGTTSRTLRHYGALGLVPPSRIGANGYRYYDETALLRLQRVLLLRELGLGLAAIGDVLAGQRDDVEALATQLELLRAERERIGRQIASLERTLDKRKGGEPLMAEEMLDGFDYSQYKEEVEQRWGAEAYASGDEWWRGMSATDRDAWGRHAAQLIADWRDAASRGIDPAGGEAQLLAQRQVDWLGSVPNLPRDASGALHAEYLVGLGEMYVADPRFAKNYGGTAGAEFVRDAMAAYVRHRSV